LGQNGHHRMTKNSANG